MKSFLVGEGPSDIGDLSDAPPYRHEREGFDQPLHRTMVGAKCEFEGQKITAIGKAQVPGKVSAAKKKAAIALALAEEDGADLLVYAVDADNDFDRRRSALEKQFSAASTPVAIAVAKETIEAWALADVEALKAVNPAARVPKRRPEDMWGDRGNPKSGHPKQVLASVLGVTPSREHFATIGAAARPKVLTARCPISFVPFAASVAAASAVSA